MGAASVTAPVGEPSGEPTFSVVVPTLGRPESLAETLSSILRCVPAPREVIVVDGDASGPAREVVDRATAEGGRSGAPSLRHLPSPPGLTRQRNRAMAEAAGDVLVFFDDDVEVAPDVFLHLARAYSDPGVVGATGRVVEPQSHRFGAKESAVRRWLFGGGPEGTFTRFGYPRYLQTLDRERDVEVMQGCFMSARRDTALRLGFDEALPGYGLAEDEDFSYRLSRLGRIRYLPGAVVHHKKTGYLSRSKRRAFGRSVVVNRAYLFRKNFRPTPAARAQFGLLVLLLVAHRLVNRDWDGARGLLEGSLEAWRMRRPAR